MNMINQSAFQTLLIAPDQLDLRLRHLHTPSDGSIRRMAQSLKQRGQLSPLIAADDGQRLIVADGFKRQSAAASIGLDSLMVMAVNTDALQTKALMYLVNRQKGFSLIDEAILIRELVEIDGLKQVEVADLMERHKSWVSRRLNMIRSLAPEIISDLQLNLLPPGSALSLARLPLCNQADVAVTIQTHQLHPQQIHRLVDLWCKAKAPDYKQFLLQFPKEALGLLKNANNHQTFIPFRWQKALWAISKIAKSIQQDSKVPKLDNNTIAALQILLQETESVCQSSFEKIKQTLAKEETKCA
jgi:ParB/RepB/Spo0J family partition protein